LHKRWKNKHNSVLVFVIFWRINSAWRKLLIHVIAKITTSPGKRQEVLAAFLANVPAVLAEKGCIEYQPVTDSKDATDFQSDIGPDTFIVVEKWATLDDLKAHAKSEHMAAYGAKVRDMIADRAVHVLENVG